MLRERHIKGREPWALCGVPEAKAIRSIHIFSFVQAHVGV